MKDAEHDAARRRSALSRLGRLGAVALALSACAPQAGTATITPGGDGDGPRGPSPDGRHDDDSMGSLKQRLDTLKAKQTGLVKAASSDAAVCEDLCSLATSICAVQQKLCQLADAHAGDDEYQALCREAHQECREAQDSCIGCVESNSSAAQ